MFCPYPHPLGEGGEDGCRERRPRKRAQGQEKEAGGRPLSKPDMPGKSPRPHPEIAPEQPWAFRGQRTQAARGEGSQVVKVCTVIVRMPPVDKADEGGHLSPGPESNPLTAPTAPASQNSKENQMVSPASLPGCQGPEFHPHLRPYPKKSQRRS